MDPKTNSTLICPHCRTTIAAGLMACPGCNALVYADELKKLAAQAEELVRLNRSAEGLECWRKAIALLPPGSKQFEIIAHKIEELSQRMDTGANQGHLPHNKPVPKSLVGLGVIGVMVWKFKFFLIFLLTKAKLLVLGLTKAQTFFSMFLAFGVYWTVWGWKFALGLVLSIYVHEMGHVYMMRRFGIAASAPTFIPGIGAVILMKQQFMNAVEDARIGLAGPVWGLATAAICYAVYLSTGWGSWGAIAKVGAWINLFNLLPVHPLDGGRGFHALTTGYKWICTLTIALMWIITHEGLLVLLLIGGVIQSSLKQTGRPVKGDTRALIEYCFLVIVLSLLSIINVPVE